ncbi:MAG TPA: STAS domain-containing protein [Casimicrobiaceae bacterium]|jgi:phospholipid transport system transporter-binding protein
MTHDAHPDVAEPVAQALCAADGRWVLAGALTISSVAEVLASSIGMPLPETGRVDLRGVDRVDSAGVALLLEWKRRAGAERTALVFENVLPSMASLAELYGVAGLLSLA